MKKTIILSSMVVAILIFSGCGGGGSNSTSTNQNSPSNNIKTVSGVVADGYIKNAKVCFRKTVMELR